MKITFEFDTLSENFDSTELEIFRQADNMARCLYDISNKVRHWNKHDDRESIPTDEIWDEIFEIINDNVNMERMGY